MAGFIASEKVEELTYDFNPHVEESGVIPEPSSKQIEQYQRTVSAAMKEAGVEVGDDGKPRLKAEDMDDLLSKSEAVESAVILATADLTGIAPKTLRRLPFRVQRAFMGWIMGVFFNPEA